MDRIVKTLVTFLRQTTSTKDFSYMFIHFYETTNQGCNRLQDHFEKIKTSKNYDSKISDRLIHTDAILEMTYLWLDVYEAWNDLTLNKVL